MSDSIEDRRRWFEEYVSRAEQGVQESTQPGVRYACPCCRYLTLSERGGYEICELCNWEDDGQDDPHADEVWGGPNGSYSLSEARENFMQHLIMYSSDEPEPRIGGRDSPLEKQAKRKIMEAFDGMVNEPGPSTVNALWLRVYHGERTLRRELNRKVQEYEARARGRDPT